MPGTRFINRLFTAELNWIPKLLGAGVVGLAIAIRVVWINWATLTFAATTFTLIIVPALTVLAAGALVRADVVHKRREAGLPIGPITRLFFGSGIWSLLIWIFAFLLVGFPLAIWIGSLTSGVPAR